MGLKIFAVILILFIAEITFLSNKKPKSLHLSKEDINYSRVTFTDIKSVHITQDGISQQLLASKAYKYPAYEELLDLNASFVEKNIKHRLLANKATHKEEVFYLKGGAIYENNQSLRIKSEELEYNTATKVAQSPLTFSLFSKQGDMQGDSFVYDTIKGHVTGKKIDYTFEGEP